MVVASVLSCNFHFLSLHILVHDSSFNDSRGDKGFQGRSLSLVYLDPVLHVVLSPPTFRHALPSEGVLSWLAPYPLLQSPRFKYRRGHSLLQV